MGIQQSKKLKQKEKQSRISTESYASQDAKDDHMYKLIDGRLYLENSDVIYQLPIDDLEIDRLHLQHYTYRYYYGSNFSAPVDEILKEGRARVLDVGCGAATWLLEMATEYPACSFTGIDISPMFPTEIKPRNVQFMQRNAVEGLPFPDETFDFVFMRIMYLSFTKEQWENVVRELSRVLKPGGWIELMECNQYLTNMGPLAKKYVRKAIEIFEEKGIPKNLAQSIPEYVKAVGCYDHLIVEPREIPVGSWGGNLSQIYLDNIASIYQTIRGAAADKYNISAEKWDDITKQVKLEINKRKCSVQVIRFYAQKTNIGGLMPLK